jgi:hypothetical protein
LSSFEAPAFVTNAVRNYIKPTDAGSNPAGSNFDGAVAQQVEHRKRFAKFFVVTNPAPPSPRPMNHTEIESALELHQKAFAFLLECRATGRAGSCPFDEATIAVWRNPQSCIRWVTSHCDQLPAVSRPRLDQIPAFAQLLSSLFATSFSVSKTKREGAVRIQVRALATRRLDGSRKSDRAKAKERKAADALRQHAFESLMAESGQPAAEALSSILRDPASSLDLTLWTYAVQLVNRTHYASQGPAAYQLWLDLPEEIRRDLNADLIWQARHRLIHHLNSSHLTTTP